MDYSPIFNKLTMDSMYKFVSLHDIRVSTSGTKAEFQAKLEEHFQYNEDDRLKFEKFYIDTEIAGRKHFYLFKAKFSDNDKKQILEKCSKFKKEDSRTFDPLKDHNQTYYLSNQNVLTIKRIQIKKIYNFIDDKENNNTLIRKYGITNIHFVEFIYIDFSKGRIYCGYDTYGDIQDKRKLKDQLFEFLNKLLPFKAIDLEQLLTSDSLNKLRFLPNCIVFSVHNQANRLDSAVFKKERADIENIEKDLKHGKYKISEIKENNPDFDVQTNKLFEAGQAVAIDDDLDLSYNKIDFYYFSDKSSVPTSFRIRMDSINNQIITFSESITKQELWDVFNRIN